MFWNWPLFELSSALIAPYSSLVMFKLRLLGLFLVRVFDEFINSAIICGNFETPLAWFSIDQVCFSWRKVEKRLCNKKVKIVLGEWSLEPELIPVSVAYKVTWYLYFPPPSPDGMLDLVLSSWSKTSMACNVNSRGDTTVMAHRSVTKTKLLTDAI